MDRHSAGRIVCRVARRDGLDKKIGPRTLRHAFIIAALDIGVPRRDVQEATSHADPRTTTRYDGGRISLDRHATYIVAAYSPVPAESRRLWVSRCDGHRIGVRRTSNPLNPQSPVTQGAPKDVASMGGACQTKSVHKGERGLHSYMGGTRDVHVTDLSADTGGRTISARLGRSWLDR
jgi:hypothetical protein